MYKAVEKVFVGEVKIPSTPYTGSAVSEKTTLLGSS
jgi:hypothetical protein